MNPIFHWIAAHTVAEKLTRECPKCHRKQVVPLKKAKVCVVKSAVRRSHRSRNTNSLAGRSS